MSYGRGVAHGAFLAVLVAVLVSMFPPFVEATREGPSMTARVVHRDHTNPVLLVEVDGLYWLVCPRLFHSYSSYLQTIRVHTTTATPTPQEIFLAWDDNGPSEISGEFFR